MQLIESQDTLLNTVRLINNLILAAILIWMIHTSLIYFICYSTNVISNHNHPNNSHIFLRFQPLKISQQRNGSRSIFDHSPHKIPHCYSRRSRNDNFIRQLFTYQKSQPANRSLSTQLCLTFEQARVINTYTRIKLQSLRIGRVEWGATPSRSSLFANLATWRRRRRKQVSWCVSLNRE